MFVQFSLEITLYFFLGVLSSNGNFMLKRMCIDKCFVQFDKNRDPGLAYLASLLTCVCQCIYTSEDSEKRKKRMENKSK